MASKHGYADKGSIRIITVVVMKRSSKGAVLVDLRVANLYQGTECWHCTYLSAACEEAHIF